MEVTYLNHFGDDLTVVNAARVSMGRKSSFDYDAVEAPGFVCEETNTVRAFCEKKHPGPDHYGSEATDQTVLPPGCDCPYQEGGHVQKLKEKDERLIKYLAAQKHEIPFAHPHVSFHFKAPIFVARQLVKHQIGLSWSEISRRYVKGEPEFWWPEVWRKGSEDIKQGSTDEEIASGYGSVVDNWKRGTEIHLKNAYAMLLNEGVCPEQARIILPLNTYTEWHWTGSLLAWARVWGLRVGKPGAQQETKECVKLIGPKMEELFPASWKALTNG